MTRPPRQPLDASSIGGTSEKEVLRTFVASVRRWRDGEVPDPVFRRGDLAILAGFFGTDVEDVERRLIALTGCDRATATRLRRMLLASLAVPVALTALTSAPPEVAGARPIQGLEELWATPAAAEPVLPTAAPAFAVPVLDAVAPATDPPPAPAATETADPQASVSIERLGIDLPIVAGGQEVIDQGLVAHYWAPGWHESAAAGATGTYWLAAHHETHGSPFRLLPDVEVGDRVAVATGGRTFTYTVTSTEVVRDDAGFGPVYGTDPSASVILLQTCLDHVRRLLVHGTLTAVS